MPRDASGNYTLPSGNPVVTGTTIDASWANDTMDDLKDEMSDSLSRSGNGGMLTAFENSDGTVSAPGITFTSETSSGIYRAGTNDVRVSIAGVDRAKFRADSSNPLQIWNGSTFTNILYAGTSSATITGTWTFSAAVTMSSTLDVTGAVTAASYGGITEANLVDKSATETITGSWTLPEASITAHEAALTILETQITDGSVYGRLADAETVTGAWTLDGSVTTANFGTGGKIKDGTDVSRPIGLNVMPRYEIDVADDFDLAHNGWLWHTDGSSTIAFTCADDSDTPQGATYVVANESSGGVQTIEEGAGVTLRWFDGSTTGGQTGDRTLASGGVCTVYKYTDTEFFIWGNGLT